MPSDRRSLLRQGHHGLADQSPGTELQVPKVTTSSQAIANTASDKSLQFNGEVGRSTDASYHQDTIQNEDNSLLLDHRYAEQVSRHTFNFNFAQSLSQHGSPISTMPRPRVTSNPPIVPRSKSMLPTNIQQALDEDVQMPLRSKSNSPVLGLAPKLPTSMSADTFNQAQPTSDSQKVMDAIQKKINAISVLYETLPQKLARFDRKPWLSYMRKDLAAQSLTFRVNVEDGELVSCLEGTLKTSALLPQTGSQRSSEDTIVQDINGRLEQIRKSLGKVDDLSDVLVTQQDRLRLPFRPRNGLRENGNPNNRQRVLDGRVGQPKKRQKSTSKTTIQNGPPEDVLRAIISLLDMQVSEFQRRCQSLKPPEPEEVSDTPIPKDLELARAAAVMLCKALCQACPNENHQVHNVLFGLLTQELDPDEDNGDTSVEFNLAFESPGESETWFVVQSTLRVPNNQAMDLDDTSDADRNAEPAHRPLLARSMPRLSFSDQIKISSRQATEEPNARFCLQYHKQAANDLAVSLKHSDIYEHRLFYPDQPRLDLIHDNGQAITLRQLLQEHNPVQQLEMLQKVQLAKLLAEAVLKFYSADWLSCDWDWDNILIYEINDTIEPHLRFKLKNPEGADSETTDRSRESSRVLSELGKMLGTIAVGPFQGNITYDTVQERFSHAYAEIMEACFNMSKEESDLGDEEVQERFYAKVVSKLEEMEEFVADEWQL
ncbi:hypothetical protein diail_3185 [Diaporthe ilicicola]|nr:hypothetical protein diail_3185 [Diaporthe ilicicola]